MPQTKIIFIIIDPVRLRSAYKLNNVIKNQIVGNMLMGIS